MNILNERIEHITFGEGTVIDQQDDKLYIQFLGDAGIKQFMYPDAFEKYLKLCNAELKIFIEREISDKKALEEHQKLKKKQEYEEAAQLKANEKPGLNTKKRKSSLKKQEIIKSKKRPYVPTDQEDDMQ